MRSSLAETLVQIGEAENMADARKQIAEARAELMERLEAGEMPYDFCEEMWGLEPDYLDDLIF